MAGLWITWAGMMARTGIDRRRTGDEIDPMMLAMELTSAESPRVRDLTTRAVPDAIASMPLPMPRPADAADDAEASSATTNVRRLEIRALDVADEDSALPTRFTTAAAEEAAATIA